MNPDAMQESYSANTSMAHDMVNAQRLIHLSIERNLERNRKHAKRTRLRKKEMMEVMKGRVVELQREAVDLEDLLQENATTSILLTLGAEKNQPQPIVESNAISNVEVPRGDIVELLKSKVRAVVAKKNRPCAFDERFKSSNRVRWLETKRNDSDTSSSDGSLFSGSSTTNGQDSSNVSSHIDSKSELYSLKHSLGCDRSDNLMDLIRLKEANDDFLAKKERNRLNSKFTRDRKKLFQVEMQRLIAFMECQNRVMREKLCRQFRGDFNP